MSGGSLALTPLPDTHFGAGNLNVLPALVRSTGCDRVVLVTDCTLVATPVFSSVLNVLTDSGITVHKFSGVSANPTTHNIASGADFVADLASCGKIAVVAVGGGSPIDAGKAIALAAVNPERGRELDYRRSFANPALPLVTVVTTAGTGAETNWHAVVTESGTGKRFYMGSPTCLPYAVILDPKLTVSLPSGATAASGMDALVHALESAMALHPNSLSHGLAMQAIRMITDNLPRAYDYPDDLEARGEMLLAANIAGQAFRHTGLGLCHAIGHALGGQFDIAHGTALTAVLPGVLRFNLPARMSILEDVAFALRTGNTSNTAIVNCSAAIDRVQALAVRVGLTELLRDFEGLTRASFDPLVKDTLADGVLINNARTPTTSDVLTILEAAY